MTIAFHAVLLIILYLPGALFFLGYWGRLSREKLPVLSPSLTGQAAFALIAAIILHTLSLSILYGLSSFNWFHYEPAPAQILNLLGAAPSPTSSASTAIILFTKNLRCHAVYMITIMVTAFFIGAATHYAIRSTKLDHKFLFLRFSNKWHYILSGESASFPQYADKYPNGIVDVWLTAVVVVDKIPFIYTGSVEDWWFAENGELDTIVLTYASREAFPMSAQAAEESEPIALPGDFFYLKYQTAQNLYVRYLSVEAITGTMAIIEEPDSISVQVVTPQE